MGPGLQCANANPTPNPTPTPNPAPNPNPAQADRAVEWAARAKGAGVVHRSSAPLLSVEDCAWAIEATEAHAAANGGWTTGRHVEAPTTDVPVRP